MQPQHNWEATIEEFLALQSILQHFDCWLDGTGLQLSAEEAERLIQAGSKGRRLSCAASVHVAVPEDGVPIQVQGGVSGAGKDIPSSSNGSTSVALAVVKHLPPICLQLDIPPGYPEDAQPDVQLICEWLSTNQIANLRQRLEDIFDEQGPGLPVGFVWVDWLQNEALQHLGLREGILLSASEGLSKADERKSPRNGTSLSSLSPSASEWTPSSTTDVTKQIGRLAGKAEKQVSNAVNGTAEHADKSQCSTTASSGSGDSHPLGAEASSTSSDAGMDIIAALVGRLVSYNAMREVEIFKEGSHTCGICLEETPGPRHVWPSSCSHAFCQDCVGQLCSVHIAEGGLDSLRCPIPDCKAPFVRQRLRGLLSEELAQRWEDLELKQALEGMPDVLYCPRCSAACVEDSDNCAQCPKCFFAFCGLCCDSWHPGVKCMSAEMKLKVLQERMAGRKDPATELKKREAEYLSLIHINAVAKMCPNCGMAIEKTMGCNKMTCSNCHKHFCYKCNMAVQDYDHFRDGSCRLFDELEITRWQHEWDAQVQVERAQVRHRVWMDMNPGAAQVPCPQCGQRNAKVLNNNLIRCWACSTNYCYLCRQLLRGSRERGAGAGSHFGKGKCKQHSA
ncbi:g10409 [Coccomyxa elongata]